jgi:hypothetical protein
MISVTRGVIAKSEPRSSCLLGIYAPILCPCQHPTMNETPPSKTLKLVLNVNLLVFILKDSKL